MIARRFLRSVALGAVVTFFASLGVAQDQMGPGLMPGFGQSPGGQPSGGAPKPKKDPDEPELHAAPGASDQVVAPGGEPSLPENPLAIKESTFERIGSDLDPDWEDHGRDLKTDPRILRAVLRGAQRPLLVQARVPGLGRAQATLARRRGRHRSRVALRWALLQPTKRRPQRRHPVPAVLEHGGRAQEGPHHGHRPDRESRDPRRARQLGRAALLQRQTQDTAATP